MNLYTKYRPQTLNEMKGNVQTVTYLKSIFEDTETMPRSFLVQGTTGCGKTTIGRIFKNHFNISDRDYIEINSSDMRGIDTVREIVQNMAFKPFNSIFRIFLIDECHKLTNDAQNAFLKPLEEPPTSVIFILCTTEPTKLIKPIRDRCQILKVDPLLDGEMFRMLKSISRKEGVAVPQDHLKKIYDISEGIPRAAIQMLEKYLSVPEDIRESVLNDVSMDDPEVIDLCRTLLAKDCNWRKISGILSNLKGTEPETIRRVVLGYCQAVLLKAYNEKAFNIMDAFIEPFYNTGFPGVVHACYISIHA